MCHCCDDHSDSVPSHRLTETAAAQSRAVRTNVKKAAYQAKDRIVPMAESAVAKMTDIVNTDIKPRVVELRDQATPIIADAGKRSLAAVASLKPDAVEPEPKRRKHPVLKFFGLAAFFAVIGLLIRALLDARDDSWQQDDDYDDLADEPTDEIIVVEQEMPDAPVVETVDEAIQDVIPLGEPEPPAKEAPHYGEGCYLGKEPPEGFNIKANDRSMKYHVPGAIGYARCVTEIWFNSSEAAEAAGFIRALR